MDPKLISLWENMAPAPRIAVLLTGAMFIVHLFIPRLMPQCCLDPNGTGWQVGRYILAAFNTPTNDISLFYLDIMSHFLMVVSLIYSALWAEEVRLWKKNSDGLYFFFFVFGIFYTIGPIVGIYSFLDTANASLEWTLYQQEPNKPGLFGVEHKYQLIVLFTVNVFFRNWYNISSLLLGIFAAHLFKYLTEFLPLVGGPKLFQSPPKFLKRWD